MLNTEANLVESQRLIDLRSRVYVPLGVMWYEEQDTFVPQAGFHPCFF